MQPECLQRFSYPWFPNVASPDRGNWTAGTFNAPGASANRPFFLLPSLDLNKRQCTPSPFVNGTFYRSSANRSAYATWSNYYDTPPIPTQCSNDLTQTIVSIIGPGPYTAPPPPGSFAELVMGSGSSDDISCPYSVGYRISDQPLPKVIAVNITVQDGPIFASDDPLYSGNELSPAWQYTVIPLLNVDKPQFSLLTALNRTLARNFTRVVSCLVTAIDPATNFPIYIQAPPKVVLIYGQPWVNFTQPMPGNYTPSNPGRIV